MSGNGNGDGNGATTAPNGGAAGTGPHGVSVSNGVGRGLDSGLAKSCPSAEGLTQKTYRSHRHRLKSCQATFKEKQRYIHRRGISSSQSSARFCMGSNGKT